MNSPFLDVPEAEWVAANRSGFAIFDKFPVTEGHALVVPRRLIATWWEAGANEQVDLMALVEEVRRILDERHSPDGYNIGINVGSAAGQTVDHLHIHLIPRYAGDVPDPRGGVRQVIPGRGNYLTDQAWGREVELFDGVTRSLRVDLLRAIGEHDRIDLIISFIMKSGLGLVESHLDDAVGRGARLRVLTTDYMDITDPDALARLLDLHEIHGEAVKVRIFSETGRSFHPKAYLFSTSDGRSSRAFIGSSNLSRPGLEDGVEWNLAIGEVTAAGVAFDQIWADARTEPLTHAWLASYRARRQTVPVGEREPAAIGVATEPVLQPVAPRELQRQALEALQTSRLDGHRAGLVVMATGLGKTWVAAFDTSRPEFRRVLFIAHRDEILRQSLEAFRQVRPEAELGLFNGLEKQHDADVVFASVQTLANRLSEFDPDEFDYLVVDEFHHAAASTYRRVIDYFDPSFLLGLTATPERMDGADLLALCGDNLVFDCDLVQGIRQGELVPFHYLGVADTVDFDPIPWRNGRFDPATLSEAVETQERAERAFDEWSRHGGQRTLAFCCTTAHADFMAQHFRARGVPCACVHSGESSDPRRQSVEHLTEGTVSVLFAVDIFNEGFDLPEIDTVLMLRPTESPVIFLQQLGRGLRLSDTKDRLQVIDFIGNHRSFLMKPRALLSLARNSEPTRRELERAAAEPESIDLPEGCAVTWDLDVVELFEQMLSQQAKATDALAQFILDHVTETGERPSAVQAFRSGLNVGVALRSGGWFNLLRDLEALTAEELITVEAAGETLSQIEREPLTKSYKLVTLRALIHDEALRTGATVEALAMQSRRIVLGDPRLAEDARTPSFDPTTASDRAWASFWRRNPIAAWTNDGKRTGSALFQLRDDRFEPTFAVPPQLGSVFDELVAELAEYRLARYLAQAEADANVISLRVSQTNGRPIIFLDRDRHPRTPEGRTEVVADGRRLTLKFVKIAVNVAHEGDSATNVLPDLLRSWFGEAAGQPGSEHRVVLKRVQRTWSLAPVNRESGAEPQPLIVDGEALDADVTITQLDDARIAVTFESAGGKRGTTSARNPEYPQAIDVILGRARDLELTVEDAYVDSERTRHLVIDERRLNIDDRPFPISLRPADDPVALRKALLRPMGAVGPSQGSKSSGNPRRRMTIHLSSTDLLSADVLEHLRTGPGSTEDGAELG